MHTVKEYRQAVKKAKRIFTAPRFGVVMDRLVRISKADALFLVQGYKPETTAEEVEMYTGEFGRWMDNGDLIVG